eukprot:TRINITY_DN9264_c2_g1_i2.p1 TRINITY_DN9264_c2_g1~~TRINITY_DN9264_c2_g1_i2.p1  ORF type:complete len:921 (+),score=80.17 TRINITY_DN9264_c2_g1_i2:59-2764(+)
MGCTDSKQKQNPRHNNKSFDATSRSGSSVTTCRSFSSGCSDEGDNWCRKGEPKRLKRETCWEGEQQEWQELMEEARKVKVTLLGKQKASHDNTPDDSEDSFERSAKKIQRWFKRITLCKKWETMYYRRIWQILDKWDERNAVRTAPKSPGLSRSRSSFTNKDISKIANEQTFNSTVENLAMGIPFKAKTLSTLLSVGTEHFKTIDNIQETSPTDNTWKCIVVGDTHGQLQDVIRIIKIHGPPIPGQTVYIFNGDYVDRGPHGCEVVGLILLMYFAFPGGVYLNRGNHEDDVVASGHNFYSDVMQKYDAEMYQHFIDFFNTLPLCTLINNDTLVVHGGVPRHMVTLEYINGINRYGAVPLCGRRDLDKDRNIICDLLWSDPSNFKGTKFNCMRGQGTIFGPDVTESFCNMQSPPLKHIIRSHECQQAGYSTTHHGLVTTVFSASDYAGVETNRGAVVVVTPDKKGGLHITHHQFKVHASSLTSYLPPRECNGLIVREEVLRMVREVMAESQHYLMVSLEAVDSARKGVLSVNDWCSEMRKLIRVPWATLRRELNGEAGEDNNVKYIEMLRQVTCPLETILAKKWVFYFVKWVLHFSRINGRLSIEGEADPVKGLFKHANKSKTGVLSYTEFHRLVTHELSCGICDRTALLLYFQMLEQDAAGVTMERWMEIASIASKKSLFMTNLKAGGTINSSRTFSMWDLWLLDRFREVLIKIRDPVTAFRYLDSRGEKQLDADNLKMTISRMSLNLDTSKTQRFTRVQLSEEETVRDICELFGVVEDDLNFVNNSKTELEIKTWPLCPSQLETWTRNAHILPPSVGDTVEVYRRDAWQAGTLGCNNMVQFQGGEAEVLPEDYRRPPVITYEHFIAMWVCHNQKSFESYSPKNMPKRIDNVLGAWMKCTP